MLFVVIYRTQTLRWQERHIQLSTRSTFHSTETSFSLACVRWRPVMDVQRWRALNGEKLCNGFCVTIAACGTISGVKCWKRNHPEFFIALSVVLCWQLCVRLMLEIRTGIWIRKCNFRWYYLVIGITWTHIFLKYCGLSTSCHENSKR